MRVTFSRAATSVAQDIRQRRRERRLFRHHQCGPHSCVVFSRHRTAYYNVTDSTTGIPSARITPKTPQTITFDTEWCLKTYSLSWLRARPSYPLHNDGLGPPEGVVQDSCLQTTSDAGKLLFILNSILFNSETTKPNKLIKKM